MEVKMIECPNCGHYYKPDMHSACPQCGHTGAAAGMGEFPKTMPPGMGGAPQSAGVGATMPVNGGGFSSAPIGVTMPVNNYHAANAAQPFGHTMPGGNLASDSQLEPVVGWLVCIEGPLRGVDFRIHDGYNYIGREEGDIHIQGDNQVSRQKHAVISFYAKRQTFHVGPADGRNIIELNNEPVFSPVEMKSFDVLTVGSTKLMLVALCGSRFSWTEGVIHE